MNTSHTSLRPWHRWNCILPGLIRHKDGLAGDAKDRKGDPLGACLVPKQKQNNQKTWGAPSKNPKAENATTTPAHPFQLQKQGLKNQEPSKTAGNQLVQVLSKFYQNLPRVAYAVGRFFPTSKPPGGCRRLPEAALGRRTPHEEEPGRGGGHELRLAAETKGQLCLGSVL